MSSSEGGPRIVPARGHGRNSEAAAAIPDEEDSARRSRGARQYDPIVACDAASVVVHRVGGDGLLADWGPCKHGSIVRSRTALRRVVAGAPPQYHRRMTAAAVCAELEPVFRRHQQVVVAYLFGSTARGDEHERSDLDLAVLFDDHTLAEYRALWGDLHDVLGARAFDLVGLNGADPVLCFDVLQDGKPIYARSAEEQNDFERRAWHRYQDTRHLRAIGDQHLRARAQEWSSERNRSASASSDSTK
jgi:hypothetical protein